MIAEPLPRASTDGYLQAEDWNRLVRRMNELSRPWEPIPEEDPERGTLNPEKWNRVVIRVNMGIFDRARKVGYINDPWTQWPPTADDWNELVDAVNSLSGLRE